MNYRQEQLILNRFLLAYILSLAKSNKFLQTYFPLKLYIHTRVYTNTHNTIFGVCVQSKEI